MSENRESVLEIENMRVEHEGRGLLFHIESAALAKSGIVLLLGRNGAGKSSLIRQLVGLVRSPRGALRWKGQGGDAKQPLLGYVPEFPVVAPGVKAREWIAWYNGVSPEQIEQLAPSYLQNESFSAARLFERQLSTLSKGELQLVQIWQQFLIRPEIGIFDEPFSGLDPWHKKALIGVLEEMSKSMALLITTHEIPAELRQAAQSVWLIENKTFQVLSAEESPI